MPTALPPTPTLPAGAPLPAAAPPTPAVARRPATSPATAPAVEESNGRGRLAAVQSFISGRAKARWSLEGPDPAFIGRQERLWNFLQDHYFRVDVEGWEHLPQAPSLMVGVHAGSSLTMDAWTFVYAWWRRYEGSRVLHGTAHDFLMALPGLGDYFRASGCIPASRESVSAALAAGHDVIVWPGGEVDSMRSWRKRDQVVLAGRKGFVKQAILSGVPIVPVATAGGADTVFVLSEGRGLARLLRGKSMLRSDICPIVLGLPFGIWPEILPTHIPLPSKIRTALLEPVHLDHDPERIHDVEYIDQIYSEVERRLQGGVNRLAKRRSFPIFG